MKRSHDTTRHSLRWLRAGAVLLFLSAFLSRCASIMAPTGGPRDSLPPVVFGAVFPGSPGAVAAFIFS